MAKFSKGQVVRTTGLNEEVTIESIRTKKGHTWYVLDNGQTLHERYLWSGHEKVAYCSQVACLRFMDLEVEIEGINFIRDEHGFRMCKHHENDLDNEDFAARHR